MIFYVSLESAYWETYVLTNMLKLFLPSVLTAFLFTTAVNLPPAAAGSTTDFQSMNARLNVYGITYDGQKFFGQVLNKGAKTLHHLMLYYKVLDERGQVLEAGRVLLLENELRGRQNGTFGGQTEAAGKNFVITSAEWIDFPALRN